MTPGTVPDKLLPFSEEAEEAVIGALLIDPGALFKADFIRPEDFYIDRYGWVFRAMLDLKGRADLIILCDELEKRGQLKDVGGSSHLTKLLNRSEVRISGIGHYAKIIEQKSLLRQQINLAGEVARSAYKPDAEPGEVNEKAIAQFLEIQSRMKGIKASMTYAEIVEAIQDRIDQARENPELMWRVSTGFRDLDKLLRGGFAEGFYLVAGATHMGKTLLAQQIAEKAAKKLKEQNQGSVLIFSLEQPMEQLVEATIESTAELNMGDDDLIRYMACLKDDDEASRVSWASFIKASAEVAGLPVRVVAASGLNPIQLYNMIRQYQYQENTRLVMVDYLNLMQAGETGKRRIDNRTLELGYIARQTKLIAGELHIPIMMLHQISRNPAGRPDKRPLLSDLRQSGEIEENLDVAMLVYRDNYYNPDTEFPNFFEVIVPKNRIDKKLGVVPLYYKDDTKTLHDIEIKKQPLEY